MKKKNLVLLTASLLSLTLLTACSSTTSTKTAGSSAAKASSAQKNKAFANNTLSLKDATIQYEKAELGKDYDGKPLSYLFFKVTNNSGEAQNAQIFLLEYLSIQQNLGNTTKNLDYAVTMNDKYDAQIKLLQNDINDKGTVELVYPVSIADESKPILLTFKDGLIGKKAGSLSIPLK